MSTLKEKNYSKETAASLGTRFVVGNGHLGYRGTLEESSKEERVALNVIGFYDQKDDKWRESVNLPNPFSLHVSLASKPLDVFASSLVSHEQTLHLDEGYYSRKTILQEGVISSLRFASKVQPSLLGEFFTFQAKIAGKFRFKVGFDEDIYDINGPHFKKKSFSKLSSSVLAFYGLTNENKTAQELLGVASSRDLNDVSDSSSSYVYELSMHAHEKVTFTLLSLSSIPALGDHSINELMMNSLLARSFPSLFLEHTQAFKKAFNFSRVKIGGNKEAQAAYDYCNYLLVSNSCPSYASSIPARGLSGQTYKGAIFWDSENFLLPYYLLNDPQEAKALLLYRIKGLKGALAKAKKFNQKGAFYAWEGQEEGREACSMYNVSDPLSGKPIRTYFVDKQIHISADVALAFKRYLSFTNDEEILLQGGLEVLYEVALFYEGYSSLGGDGLYHFFDVIGPDEYHERVADNAFTNYLAYEAISYYLYCFKHLESSHLKELKQQGDYQAMLSSFSRLEGMLEKIYLPQPNKEGVIEQFTSYFKLEDCGVLDLKKRLKDPKEYWGGKDGVATPTRVIKQADVVALLVFVPQFFTREVLKANYDFYKPYTEGGSSLSASMYSLIACKLSYYEEAYQFFLTSARADLTNGGKEYAGGIYIGGSHMASAGGAYLSLVYGMAGLEVRGNHLSVKGALPQEITSLSFKVVFNGKIYQIKVNHKTSSVTCLGGQKDD